MLALVTHDNLYPDETAANVRLIVAAPELLESCAQLLELLERCLSADRQLDSNVAIPLCLETLFDDLGKIQRS